MRQDHEAIPDGAVLPIITQHVRLGDLDMRSQQAAVKGVASFSKLGEECEFGHTPSSETPMAMEVASSPGVTRTPLTSALAREDESAGPKSLRALTYGLFMGLMVAAVVLIHGRYRRESDEE